MPPLGPDGVSLRFVAWNAGKRSLVVDGATDARLVELLQGADVVLDTPGWPGALELDAAVAPQAVWVSVTPFGRTGPRAGWKAGDLGVMASTGNMYCTGDPDRPPVRCTEPTGWAHVGPEAAMAALTALASGRPQRVDVSAQEAVMIASMGHAGRFARSHIRGQRSGAKIGATREIWPCADGFVSFGLRGGKSRAANMQTITRLVDQDGLATPALTERDWTTYDHNVLTATELEAIAEPVAAYFARHSMAELYETAVATNLMLAPANSPHELVASRQLAARDYFGRVGDIDHFPRSFLQVTSPGNAVARPGATERAVAVHAIDGVDAGLDGESGRRVPWRDPTEPGMGGHAHHRIRHGRGGAHRRALLRRARSDGHSHRVALPPGLPAHVRTAAGEPVRPGWIRHVRRRQRRQARGDAQLEASGGRGTGPPAHRVGRRGGRELRAASDARLRPRLPVVGSRPSGLGHGELVPAGPDGPAQGLPRVRRAGLRAQWLQLADRLA